MIELQSDFRCYQLTPQEEAEALKLTTLQRAYFQNLLGEAAHAKINLMIDPAMPAAFLQQEAYLTAKLDLLRAILNPAELALPVGTGEDEQLS